MALHLSLTEELHGDWLMKIIQHLFPESRKSLTINMNVLITHANTHLESCQNCSDWKDSLSQAIKYALEYQVKTGLFPRNTDTIIIKHITQDKRHYSIPEKYIAQATAPSYPPA